MRRELEYLSRDTGANAHPFVFQGEDLLHRMAALSKQKIGDRRIKVGHPNTKSYSIVLDAYAKPGLVDEVEALHDKLTEISNSS